jgi:hypothetical protein
VIRSISVDTKKKELIGDFKKWRQRVGNPRASQKKSGFMTSLTVNSARSHPTGFYDLTTNTGWVSVGIDHDTAEFAVESIRRWWRENGDRWTYPNVSPSC